MLRADDGEWPSAPQPAYDIDTVLPVREIVEMDLSAEPRRSPVTRQSCVQAALRAEIIKRMSGDPRFRKLAPDPVRPAGYRVVVIRDGEETEIDADLTNLFGYIEDGATSSRAEELIATHIGAVASVASSHEGQTELLVANIRSADELKQMQTSSTPGTSNAFMADPFVGDLAVIYQYDLR